MAIKKILLLLVLFLPVYTYAQHTEFKFIEGTWKMENRESYEYWVKVSENTFKGFSYQKRENEIRVSEFLDIKNESEKIVYTATVIGQNSGVGIQFTQIESDSAFVFINPEHDFPTRIVYQMLNPTEVQVTVSGNGDQQFSYTLQKVSAQR